MKKEKKHGNTTKHGRFELNPISVSVLHPEITHSSMLRVGSGKRRRKKGVKTEDQQEDALVFRTCMDAETCRQKTSA